MAKKNRNVLWLRPVLEYMSKQKGIKSYNEIINETKLLSRENKNKVLRQSRNCPTPRHFQQVVRGLKEIKSIRYDATTMCYKYIPINQLDLKQETHDKHN